MGIKEQLVEAGVNEDKVDAKGLGIAKGFLSYGGKTPYDIIESHMEEFSEVYSSLCDERSREVYMGNINYKISLDNDYLSNIADSEKEQYFDKGLIRLKDDEVFCDCGSYNGDTLDIFCELSNGKYEKYIAIEAEGNTYNDLNKNIETKEYKNIKTLNLACWDQKAELRFEPQQTAGHVSSVGTNIISADTLDCILEGQRVSFIKMDIEGAEERALIGAKETIMKYKPILAICLYHSLEDFYKLPLIMKEFNQEYNFYVRHYMYRVDSETVCYAIPKDRMVD